MALARLFPIDAPYAQESDRTFSERLLKQSADAFPPGEKTTACQDQAWKFCTGDGARNGDARQAIRSHRFSLIQKPRLPAWQKKLPRRGDVPRGTMDEVSSYGR